MLIRKSGIVILHGMMLFCTSNAFAAADFTKCTVLLVVTGDEVNDYAGLSCAITPRPACAAAGSLSPSIDQPMSSN